MLPEERRIRIHAHLEKYESATIRDLAQIFEVSEMTIHRDLLELATQGDILKVRGGALFKPKTSPAPTDRCTLCRHPLRPHLAFTVVTGDGCNLAFCCAHCGLLAWPRLQGVEAVLATDMLSARTVNALTSWYVVSAVKAPCCTPGVFVFETRDDAKRFALGFAGRAVNFEKALRWVTEQMAPAGTEELNTEAAT